MRFYSNMVSQVSQTAAAVMFIAGLMLIGFGFLIWLLPKLFAMLAALVFFIMGGCCALTAIKIFIAQGRVNKSFDDGRENVRIHRDGF